ncbi:hypothetical protein L9F63_000717 [Diploptera punctata]|uniref:Uncharacterized protein n=1 Tax=Diploptera punctata TaxID=6984 RepID=A0AAD8ESG8_DIPPU|nr:hypothetical protein L9F63_000717 [Diploptera punctata]
MKPNINSRRRELYNQTSVSVDKNSWSRVREDIIVKSFKKCGVSNALDGSEDHLMYEEDNDDNEEKEEANSGDDFQGSERFL